MVSRCSCDDGVVSCTNITAITDRKEDKGVRFPGTKDSKDDKDDNDSKDDKDDNVDVDSKTVEEGCTDQRGVKRREEEIWEEKCNTCR